MDSRVVALKFEQNKKTFVAGRGTPHYKIVSIDGVTGLDFDFNFTNNPQIPGRTINHYKPMERVIDIEIDSPWYLRDEVIKFFNPYHQGKLIVTWNDVQRWIPYICYPVLVIQDNVHKDITLQIKLVCPEPYFLGMSDFGVDIAQKENLLAFPFVLQSDRGLIADIRLYETHTAIINNGDVDTGITIRFRALAAVTGPRLTLDEGVFFHSKAVMAAGDVLEVSTHIDNIYAKKNGLDVLNETDPLSAFFQIPPGQHVIQYSADEGTANLSVQVFFTPMYLGV